MGLPLPLATCLSWVGPPSNLGGGSARAVFLLVSQLFSVDDRFGLTELLPH